MVFVQSNSSKKMSLDKESTPNGTQMSQTYDYLKATPPERSEDGVPLPPDDSKNLDFKEMTDAIRCVRVSPDGTELACGDWLGNIRIYDLTNLQSIEQKKFIEAHNMEVICLAYSP